MTTIACLHAAESNIAVFDQALTALDYADVRLLHRVEAGLFAQTQNDTGLTAEIAAATRLIVDDLCQQADAVIISCTTLGAAAWQVEFARPVLRIDATLAKVASRYHGKVLVLCTAHSTLESTSQLFGAFITPDRLSVELIPRAWAWFNQGDIAGYHHEIADYLRQRPEEALGCIVLAQASMSGAEQLIHSTLAVLTGPQVVLQAAIDALA